MDNLIQMNSLSTSFTAVHKDAGITEWIRLLKQAALHKAKHQPARFED